MAGRWVGSGWPCKNLIDEYISITEKKKIEIQVKYIGEKFKKGIDFCKHCWYCVVLTKGRCNTMKILEELWYGNVRPSQRTTIPTSKEAELIGLLARNEQELLPLLSDQAKKVYDKLRENQDELNGLNESLAFQKGFHLAAKMMVEVMEGILESYTIEL